MPVNIRYDLHPPLVALHDSRGGRAGRNLAIAEKLSVRLDTRLVISHSVHGRGCQLTTRKVFLFVEQGERTHESCVPFRGSYFQICNLIDKNTMCSACGPLPLALCYAALSESKSIEFCYCL